MDVHRSIVRWPQGWERLCVADFHTNNLHVHLLNREARTVVRALDDAGIPALTFKGVALAALIYGDATARAAGDLDLLLRAEDVVRALDVLAALGYTPILPLRMDRAREQRFVRLETQRHFVRSDPFVNLDLHWRLTPSHGVAAPTFHELWQRRTPVQLGDAAVPTLGVADTLLLLCVHGACHGWSHAKWLDDVAQLLRRFPDLDWDWTWRQAHRLRAGRMLSQALALAHARRGAPLPAHVLQRLQAHRHLPALLAAGDPPGQRALPGEAAYQLRLREGVWPRLAYVAGALKPTAMEVASRPLPAHLWWLYGPYRLLCLARRAMQVRPAVNGRG